MGALISFIIILLLCAVCVIIYAAEKKTEKEKEEEAEKEAKIKEEEEIKAKIKEEEEKPKKLLSENEYKHFLVYFDIHHYYYSPTKNILFLNPGTYDALRDKYKLNFYNANTDTYDTDTFLQFIKHEFNIKNIQTLTVWLSTSVICSLRLFRFSYVWIDLTISDFIKKLSAI